MHTWLESEHPRGLGCSVRFDAPPAGSHFPIPTWPLFNYFARRKLHWRIIKIFRTSLARVRRKLNFLSASAQVPLENVVFSRSLANKQTGSAPVFKRGGKYIKKAHLSGPGDGGDGISGRLALQCHRRAFFHLEGAVVGHVVDAGWNCNRKIN